LMVFLSGCAVNHSNNVMARTTGGRRHGARFSKSEAAAKCEFCFVIFLHIKLGTTLCPDHLKY
jgi:hypothetical protein